MIEIVPVIVTPTAAQWPRGWRLPSSHTISALHRQQQEPFDTALSDWLVRSYLPIADRLLRRTPSSDELLWLFRQRILELAIAHVGDGTDTANAGSPGAAAITYSPTTGNALVVFVTQATSASRTYAVTDNIDGATGWNTAKYFNGPTNARAVGIFYKVNVPAGITSVTVTVNTGTNAFTANVAEFSGMGTAITVDASDSVEDAITANSHLASVTGVTSTNAVIAAVAGALGPGTGTECNPGASYTEVTSGLADSARLKQWQIFAAGATLETGTWASTGTARIGTSVIALLSGNAAAASSIVPIVDRHYRQRRN